MEFRADGIACWLIDTDYNEESFFVLHAYFLGANDKKLLFYGVNPFSETRGKDALYRSMIIPFQISVHSLF